MDLIKLIKELRAELQQIEQAILAFEQVAEGGAKRRGRPPKWLLQAREQGALPTPPRRRGSRPGKRAAG